MLRTTLPLFALFALATGCTTTKQPPVKPAPAPAAETVAFTIELQPLPSQPQRVFQRAATMEHTWTDARHRRMRVALSFNYSTTPGEAEAASSSLAARWSDAEAAMRQICESADLTTEAGTQQCEEHLREALTAALFPESTALATATVENLFWRRVVWN
jgi:hypothetical protein